MEDGQINLEAANQAGKPVYELNEKLLQGLLSVVNQANATSLAAKDESQSNKSLIYALLWVLAIAFGSVLVSVAAIFMDQVATKTVTYQILVDKVAEQNLKIEQLLQRADTEGGK
jgi:hypothetical protein